MTEVYGIMPTLDDEEKEAPVETPVIEEEEQDHLGEYLDRTRTPVEGQMDTVSTIAPDMEVPEDQDIGFSKESKDFLNYSADIPVMEMSTTQVKEGMQRGDLTGEQVDMYIARKELADRGLMGMSPESVKWGLANDLLTENQVDAYLDRHEGSTLGYVFREAKNTVLGGLAYGAENTIEGFGELGQLFIPIPGLKKPSVAMETIKHDFRNTLPGVSDFIEDNTAVHSTPAQIAQPFVQFAIPYAGVRKAVQARGIAAKVINSTVGKKVSTKMGPDSAKWLGRVAEETIAGGVADYFVFDPYEGGLANMLAEQFELQETALDFFKTNPDNPAPVERLKLVLEGAALGVGFDTMLSAFKYTKGKLWATKGGNKELIAEEVDKLGDHLGIEIRYEPDEAIKEVQKNYVNGKVQVSYKRFGDKKFRKRTFNSDAEVDFWYKDNAEGLPVEKIDEVSASQTGVKGEVDTSTPKGKDDPQKGKSESKPKAPADVDAQGAKVPHRAIHATDAELKQNSIRLFNEEDVAESSEEWISKLEVDGAGERMVRQIATLNADDIKDVRGNGPIKHVETDEMAEQFLGKLLGKNVNKAMGGARKLMGDVEGLHFRIRALNKFFVRYTEGIQEMINIPEKMTFQEELRVVEHINKLQELQAIVFGVRTEMGRGLSQYNLPWEKYQGAFDAIKNLPEESLMDLAETRPQVQKAVQAFRNAKNAPAKLKAARAVGQNPKMMGVLEYVQANLLWNPHTFIANIIGGSMALLNNSMKRYAGLRMHKAFGGGGAETMKEWEAYRYGLAVGVKTALALPGVTKKSFKNPSEIFKGMKYAWDGQEGTGRVWAALFTGKPQLDRLVRVEGQNTNGILDSLNFNVKGARLPLGTLIKLPFHGLTAGDEFLKSIGYFSELHAQAAREGIDMGKTGKELDDFLNWRAGQPDADLHYKALANAREITFTEQLGPAAEGVNKALNTKPGIAMKIAAIPFYKVIINLVKYAGRNSPLGLFGGRTREAIKGGGRDMYEAITGVAMGTGMMLTAGQMYSEGMITGRIPPDMRDTYAAKGIPAYSLKIGGHWYSYERLDPLSQLIGVGADLAMAWDYVDAWRNTEERDEADAALKEVGIAIISAISEPILNKTMAKSMQDIAGVVLQPDRNPLGGEVRNQLQKFIPASTALGFIQNQLDETLRETNTVMDVVWAKIDSNNRLPNRHSLYGTIQKRDDQIPALGLLKRREENTDLVENELMKIGFGISEPSDIIHKTDKNTGISADYKLTPEEYDEYQQLISQVPIKEELTKLINHPQYQQNGNYEERGDEISSIISDGRKFARDAFLRGDKDIQDTLIRKFKRRNDARINGTIIPTSYGEIQTLINKYK